MKKRQERIAKDTGLSYKSLARLEEVADMEKKHPELGDLIGKIDSNKMNLNQAWKITRAYKKRERCLAQAKGLENRHKEDLKLRHGDFRQRIEEVADNSIDLIFTDPPYDRESLTLYYDLGRLAARVLKPGSSLVAYAPHHTILEMGSQIMQPGLRQVWTFCVEHIGHLARIASLHLRVNWKPLVWLVKGESQPNVIPDATIDDLITSTPPDKDLHEWAQSLTEVDYMIKHLTVEGQVVLDCFMGTGTTGLAALNNKRRFIGIEINQQTFELAKARLQSFLPAVLKKYYRKEGFRCE